MKRVTVRCLSAGIAVLVLLVGASSALAFGVTNVTVTPRAIAQGEPGFGQAGLVPADPFAAGAHPALDIVTDFDISATPTPFVNPTFTTVETFTQHLGPGIIADPKATGTCTRADFKADSAFLPSHCAASTQVGTTTVTLLSPGIDPNDPSQTILLPRDLPGKLFNLAPAPGEAAALGVELELSPADPNDPNSLPFMSKVVSPISVDPKDFGLNAKLQIPALIGLFTRIKLTLWGYAAPGLSGGNPQLAPFFTNPTSCTPASVGVSASSFPSSLDSTFLTADVGDVLTGANSGSFTPTDCAHEPFDSSVSLTASPASTDSPSEVTVHLDPAAPAGAQRVTSYVKRASVTLPPGMFLNPVRADGTDVCTDDQFDRSNRSDAADCPASSQIGTASFAQPQLGDFTGKVYLSTGNASDVIRLFVDVPLTGLSPDVHVKLVGDVRPDPVTGQVTTVFDRLPQTAFTDFTLKLDGGAHAGLITPAACGTGSITADLTAFADGVPDSTPSSPFTTSFDGNGAACPGLFRPSLSASLSNPASGSTSSYSLTFARPDRDKQFDAASINLPAGLVGNLALPGLTKCSLEAAEAGACRTSSRLGPAQVKVGPASQGSTPVTLTGDVFLTEALQPGDPAGLSVRVPARIGAIDLGRTIIPVRLALRPDGGLTATTSLPQFQQGVPTEVSSATITIDRPGFMRTPSSCGNQLYGATFTAIGGGSASAAFTGSLSGCERLGFAPKLSVKLNAAGATKAGKHPSLSTVLTQRAGEAAPRSVRVVLPAALSTNLKALNAACTQAAYDAGRCGSAASPGTATATSPLISGSLAGTAYFVKTSSGKLPKLVVALRGPLSIDVTGALNVARNGQLTTTIAAPDLPITRFALSLHGGSRGVLITNKSLCSKKLVTLVQSVGQNGKKANQRAATAITGCSKAKPKPKPKKKPKKAKKRR
jgi:hypothetical protein